MNSRHSHNAATIADALASAFAGLIVFVAFLGLMSWFMPTEIGAVVDSIIKAAWGFTWRAVIGAAVIVAGCLCLGAAVGSER